MVASASPGGVLLMRWNELPNSLAIDMSSFAEIGIHGVINATTTNAHRIAGNRATNGMTGAA
jgi:hypothetical protein